MKLLRSRPIQLAVATVLLTGAAFAFAGQYSDKCMPRGMYTAHFGMPPDGAVAMMPPMPPFLHGLKLNDVQQDAIFKLLYEQEPALYEKSKLLSKLAEELHQMVTSGKFDQNRARVLASQAASVTAELILLRTETESHVFGLLTPEQRNQVKAGRDENPRGKTL